VDSSARLIANLPINEGGGCQQIRANYCSKTAWQATFVVRLSNSSGRSRRHLSKTIEQRGLKAQPVGGSIGDGSSPVSTMRSFFAVGSATGVAERRARV
jgi:hypothetical protein